MDSVENVYNNNKDKAKQEPNCCEKVEKGCTIIAIFFVFIFFISIILRLTIIILSFIYSLNLIFIILNILCFILSIINGVLFYLFNFTGEETEYEKKKRKITRQN